VPVSIEEQVQARSSPIPKHLCIQTYFEAVNMEKAGPHIWTVVFNDFSPSEIRTNPTAAAVNFYARALQ
jgi:hypothetical protein